METRELRLKYYDSLNQNNKIENNNNANEEINDDTNNETNSLLLSYQIPHKLQLYECLKMRNRVLDGSDTGCGKTYCAIAACKDLNLQPFIVCPKAVIPIWIEVCKIFDVEYFGISNYEMLKNCNYYTSNFEKTKCPYMDKNIEQNEEKPENKNMVKVKQTLYKDISSSNKEKPKKIKKKEKTSYTFYFPDNVMIIFDEAHRCKNISSETSKILLGMSACKNKIMLLSATISDKIECFKPFGIFFGFYKDPKQFKMWLSNKMKIKKNWVPDDLKLLPKYLLKDKMNKNESMSELDVIHSEIYPNYGSRIKIKELGELFPKTQVMAKCYYLENHKEIEELYCEINDALCELNAKEQSAECLAKIIYARQKIEMLKVTIFMELIQEALDGNWSVVVFVNFLETMNYLCYHLQSATKEIGGISIVVGGQSIDERNSNIDNFQNNKKRLLIATMQSGGVGLSLHDIHKTHPRMSIISPTWSGQDQKQCLGRIHRANGTPSIQKIVYVAKTYEEKICQIIKDKFTTIDAINDGIHEEIEIQKDALEEIEKCKEPKKTNKNDNVDFDKIEPIETRLKKVNKKKYKTHTTDKNKKI